MGINNFQWLSKRVENNHAEEGMVKLPATSPHLSNGKTLRLTNSRNRCLHIDERNFYTITQYAFSGQQRSRTVGLLARASVIAIVATIAIVAVVVLPETGDAQIVPPARSKAAPQPQPQSQPRSQPQPQPTNPPPASGTAPAGSLEELFGVTPPNTATNPSLTTDGGLNAQDTLLELLREPDEQPVEPEPSTPAELPAIEPASEAPPALTEPATPMPTMPAAEDRPAVSDMPEMPVLKPAAKPAPEPASTPAPTQPAPSNPAPAKPAVKAPKAKPATPRQPTPPAPQQNRNQGLPSDLLKALEQPDQGSGIPQAPVPAPVINQDSNPGLLPSNIIDDLPNDRGVQNQLQPGDQAVFQIDAAAMGEDTGLTPLDKLLNQQRSVLGGASLDTNTVQPPPAIDIADSPAIASENIVEAGFIDTMPMQVPVQADSPIPQVAPNYTAEVPGVNPADEAALQAAIAAELESALAASAPEKPADSPAAMAQPPKPVAKPAEMQPNIAEQRAATPYQPKPDQLSAPDRQELPATQVISPAKPAPYLQANLPVNTRLIRLLFRQYHTAIPKESTADLQRLARLLRQNPGSVVQLQGYASYVKNGSLSATEHLSRKRAMLVAQQLQGLGVQPRQLQAVAMGVDFRGAVPKDRVDVVVVR